MSDRFDSAWLLERERRLNPPTTIESPSDAVEREETLHQQIIDYCNRQFPKWKFRHARMDLKTTEEVGVEDFTVFASGNRTFHFEAKAKGRKRTTEQLAWAMEMRLLGHEVRCIEAFSQFVSVVEPVQFRCETCQQIATAHIKEIGCHFCQACLEKIDQRIKSPD